MTRLHTFCSPLESIHSVSKVCLGISNVSEEFDEERACDKLCLSSGTRYILSMQFLLGHLKKLQILDGESEN